jgi:hypothetical protein
MGLIFSEIPVSDAGIGKIILQPSEIGFQVYRSVISIPEQYWLVTLMSPESLVSIL